MNGEQQRKQRTLAVVLEDIANSTATQVERLDTDIRNLDATCLSRLTYEADKRQEQAHQQRQDIDRSNRLLLKVMGEWSDFRSRGFWGRLIWALTGR